MYKIALISGVHCSGSIYIYMYIYICVCVYIDVYIVK